MSATRPDDQTTHVGGSDGPSLGATPETTGLGSTDPQRVARRRRIKGWAVGLGLALSMLFALGAWAVSSPVGSSPDDAFHLDSIWCAGDQPGPECGAVVKTDVEGVGKQLLPVHVAKSPCYAQRPTESAACQSKLSPGLTLGAVNDGLYPQGFYRTLHVFAGSDVARSVLTMRMFNAALACLLIGIALAVAPLGLRKASAVAWMVTMVPLGMFFIPSTNPTSWVVTGLGVYWVFLTRFLVGARGWVTWSSGFLAVFAALLATAARTDGSAFLCVITAASVLISIDRLRDVLSWRYLLPVALVLLGLVRFLTQQSSSVVMSGASTQDASEPGRSGLTLLANNIFNLPSYIGGIFGQTFGLGWIDTLMPPGVSAGTMAAAAGVLLVTMGAMWRSKTLAVVLLSVTFVVVPLLVLQQSHARVGETVQPRYLYPIAIALIGVVAYMSEDVRRPRWQLGAVQLGLIVVAVTGSNALALHAEIRRYVTGTDNQHLNLNAGVEWWWSTGFSPMAVWLVGALAGGVFFTFLALLILGRSDGSAVSREGAGAVHPSVATPGHLAAG